MTASSGRTKITCKSEDQPRFPCIHLFRDGNGRVSASLLQCYL